MKTKALTKWRLYLYSMSFFLVLSAILGLFVFACIFVLSLVGYQHLVRTPHEVVLLSGIVAVFIFLFCSFLFSLIPLPQLRQIARQEGYLGICFSDEMKSYRIEVVATQYNERKYQLKRIDDESMDWFVVLDGSAIIAFKRDYIIDIGEHIGEDSYFQKVIVFCVDGTKQVVRGTKDTILEFREWFSECTESIEERTW